MVNLRDFIRRFPGTDDTNLRFVSLRDVARRHPRVARFPVTVRILLEAALRHAADDPPGAATPGGLLDWRPGSHVEIPVWVSRVLLQDASGIPLLGDLAAMRAAAVRAGVPAGAIRPRLPIDLVIDHSVVVDAYGDADARLANLATEYRLNDERFRFVKWATQAFDNLRVFAPGSGIVHQINLEFVAGVIAERDGFVFPDSVVGTDSHTTMINGLGVLGWGVGGLEGEIALLGEPLFQRAPDVVAVHLTGRLGADVCATDAALHLTHALRGFGVVGKFLEFVGPGARALSLPDRATIANMAPEYGATTAYFSVDDATLAYLLQTGRPAAAVERIRAYYAEQDLFGIPDANELDYSDVLTIDLSAVRPTLAGPARPQQKIALADVPASLPNVPEAPDANSPDASRPDHGAVVLAAITSCTNTANPSAILAAGLLARNAAARGLRPPRYVKIVLAPGSRAVTRYLERAGLLKPLEDLGFFVAAYGCASCVGNTGALAAGVEDEIRARNLTVAAVLSGNRNFEGRIHRDVKANYLASPALVVAFALAGTVTRNLDVEPLGRDSAGAAVFLADLQPSAAELDALVAAVVDERAYAGLYHDAGGAADEWTRIAAPGGALFAWDDASDYFVEPPFFAPLDGAPGPVPVRGARVLAVLGDGVTTDHISPVGDIAADSVAAHYLRARGVVPHEFNSYGARRGNHHVMMRGTFANPRLRNRVTGDGFARSARDGASRSLFEVAVENQQDGVPSVIVAGDAYGSGSARDWAARGTALLGIAAVIARGFERIHRSNLALLGVLPVEVPASSALDAVAWTGAERIDIEFDPGTSALRPPATVIVSRDGAELARVAATLRIDTAAEWGYLRGGGVLRSVFARHLAAARDGMADVPASSEAGAAA
ncbi:aconitate hydratase [Burkholderia ubonensis]|uniref:aconitate hydratase AcnA n=1 Tax=Burkholderia ubonensis TaxID=101571 RepID=UPI000757CE6A|nr:aconitate hydratase AcnA [Burkholderia ubonensis]KVT64719.1 aconitate hydratase [Burkholderia ubonensis]